MRIISGEWKGRRLISVKGKSTRPTSDRVRESVFNILRDRVNESNILDIFAGTGSMGFEALSRGGMEAVFIEKNNKAANVIAQNAKLLGCIDMIKIIKKDVFKAIDDLAREKYIFDLIFMDPPYNTKIESSVLSAILEANILSRPGLIVIEHDSNDRMPNDVGILMRTDMRKYGNTGVSLYERGDLK